MRLSLMIEGQEGVTWPQWVELAGKAESLGFQALFRSDHYMSLLGNRDRGSLDAWGTMCGLAAVTSSIRLGVLVSPASFRHPSLLAKMAVTADHISYGRVEVGVGAGWNEAEHRAYGFPFRSTHERIDVLSEQLEVVTKSWSPGEFSYRGRHYTIDRLDARPKPIQGPRPPLILGGRGGRRSVSLAARFADEYNTFEPEPERCRELRRALDEACRTENRRPETLPLSVMTGIVVGRDANELRSRARRLAEWRGEARDPDEYLSELERTWLVGTPDAVAARVAAYTEAGVDRMMVQHQVHTDHAALDLLAEELLDG